MSAFTHVLRSDLASLEIVPSLGAKVLSLRRAGGREWLAPPVRPVRRPAVPAGLWSDYDCAGWDECFPNIAPDSARGLADHGDLWSQSWQLDEDGSRGALVTSARTRGHLFERSLRWQEDAAVPTLVADYRLVRTDEGDPAGLELGWAWAQHPLLSASAGMLIELPAQARVRADSAWRDGCLDDDISWLAPAGQMATSTSLRSAVGRAAKVWFEPPLPSWVRIRAGSEWISWRTDDSVPALGLWVNLGGWSGGEVLAHVAVEPAFGSHDLLDADGPRGPALTPGGEWRWRTSLQLGQDNE